MSVTLAGDAVQGGKTRLWVGRAVIDDLGNQRVLSQPEFSGLRSDGMVYEFPAEGTVRVEFQLQPSEVGFHQIRIGRPGLPPLTAGVLVLT